MFETVITCPLSLPPPPGKAATQEDTRAVARAAARVVVRSTAASWVHD
jgi:hypothetical protein